ncbi:MAG TPA: hypothetical protein VKU02_30820 [Gemmataceae bacterium]|nr:hypothetical protein [Gemmataceae bacterium]
MVARRQRGLVAWGAEEVAKLLGRGGEKGWVLIMRAEQGFDTAGEDRVFATRFPDILARAAGSWIRRAALKMDASSGFDTAMTTPG